MRVGRAKKDDDNARGNLSADSTVLSANGVEKNVVVVQKKIVKRASALEIQCRPPLRLS